MLVITSADGYPRVRRRRGRQLIAGAAMALALVSCRAGEAASPPVPIVGPDVLLINRLTWGANPTEIARFQQMGREQWIAWQLRPDATLTVPAPVADTMAAMRIATEPMDALAAEHEALRIAARTTEGGRDARLAEYAHYQHAGRDASIELNSRTVLRDLYSDSQLREQMTWFWFNHFNVRTSPVLMRGLMEDVLRPNALGSFCEMVRLSTRHPAMLVYLNNVANRRDKLNENHARELLELHTMGVGSGYSQRDVEELAKIMTGVGVDMRNWPPPPPPSGGVRQGIFLFDPAQHDNGPRQLLGQPIRTKGLAGLDEATGRLCRHPATQRRIVTKLALFMVSETPSPALVDQLTRRFGETDGDIRAVMETMIRSPEFTASLGTLYKMPQHFAWSALRLAHDGSAPSNPSRANRLLSPVGQPMFGRQTPDGYPLDPASWSSSGQLEDRFRTAEAISRNGGGLSGPSIPGLPSPPIGLAPDIRRKVTESGMLAALSPETRAVLATATNDREWAALYLSSPEFMRR